MRNPSFTGMIIHIPGAAKLTTVIVAAIQLAASTIHGRATGMSANATPIPTALNTRKKMDEVYKVSEFHRSYLKARREVVSQANARIQQNAGAAATLLKMMIGQEVPAAARIRAALSVMQLSQKSFLDEDLEMRIAAAEATIDQNS